MESTRCTKAQWCDTVWYVQVVVIKLKRKIGTRKQQGTHQKGRQGAAEKGLYMQNQEAGVLFWQLKGDFAMETLNGS